MACLAHLPGLAMFPLTAAHARLPDTGPGWRPRGPPPCRLLATYGALPREPSRQLFCLPAWLPFAPLICLPTYAALLSSSGEDFGVPPPILAPYRRISAASSVLRFADDRRRRLLADDVRLPHNSTRHLPL